MKTIYIDKNFICHSNYIKGRKKYVVDFLDDVPNECIEYYRYVPDGEVYVHNNKKIFGEFIQVIKSDEAVQLVQLAKKNIKQEEDHLNELAELIEVIYEQDMEMIDNV